MKVCSGCGQGFVPATKWRHQCTPCTRAYQSAWRAKRRAAQPPRFRSRDWATILADAKARGLGIRPLARELGCDSGAVYQAAKRYGVELPKPEDKLPPTIVALYVPTGVEQWRVIPWTDGRYEASSEGRIRRAKDSHVLAQRPTKRGYRTVGVWIHGGWKTQKVHRLVAWAFVSNPDGLPFVNHDDLDKSNNRPRNLIWSTFDDNFEHGKRAGVALAKNNPKVPHKLSAAQVVRLREMAASGFNPEDLAAHFGCSPGHAYNIINGRRRAQG